MTPLLAARQPCDGGGVRLSSPDTIEGEPVDEDLEAMTRDQLAAEVKRLRRGIRTHRDSTGHDLCWHHPALWGLLPEKTDPLPTVPAWPDFLRGCLRYRQSLDDQLPNAPRTHAPWQGD